MLLDPFEESSDDERVFQQFCEFINAYAENFSFGSLKKIKWKVRKFQGIRPYQEITNGVDCGPFIMHYMDVLGTSTTMESDFKSFLFR